MPAKSNLKGQRFGALTVVEETSKRSKKGEVYWTCKCDCGNTTQPIMASHLKSGHTKSCGCFQKKQSKNANEKHGLSTTRIYSIWNGMKNRCYREYDIGYKNYGGRGIKICDEWLHNFEAFYEWAISNGYADNLTIDRIDTNGNYEPSNCRWATMKEQQNNKRNSKGVGINER